MSGAARLTALALVLAVLVPAAGTALAHRLKVFATAEGAAITGSVYFPGGGRAGGQVVRVLGPGGEELGEIVTDGEGAFTFEAARRIDHRFVVRTGDGHLADFLVPAEQLPARLPGTAGAVAAPEARTAPAEAEAEAVAPAPAAVPGVPAAGLDPAMLEDAVARAVAREVTPLRHQIEAYEERLRLRDILGGVGWIAGLAGLAFFVLGRRRGG